MEEDRSALLIVVGREDTGDLEAQVRGSKFAWDTRLVSVDSLCNLLLARERLDDVATSTMISEILRPREYTRLDPIVSLIFATSTDVEEGDTAPEPTLAEDGGEQGDSLADIGRLRDAAVDRVAAKLGVALVRQTRSAYQTPDRGVSVICLPSKRYARGRGNWYWFTFRESQQSLLDEAAKGFVCFVCGALDRLLMVPKEKFIPLLAEMRSTRGRYQVEIDWAAGSVLLMSPRRDLTEYMLV